MNTAMLFGALALWCWKFNGPWRFRWPALLLAIATGAAAAGMRQLAMNVWSIFALASVIWIAVAGIKIMLRGFRSW